MAHFKSMKVIKKRTFIFRQRGGVESFTIYLFVYNLSLECQARIT